MIDERNKRIGWTMMLVSFVAIGWKSWKNSCLVGKINAGATTLSSHSLIPYTFTLNKMDGQTKWRDETSAHFSLSLTA
jgi:hypothetical protein